MIPPRLQFGAVVTVVAVAGLAAALARLVAPVVLGGPPAPGTAWVGWLCASGPFAAAVGCGAAVQRHRLGSTWNERWLVAVAGWGCGAFACLVLLTPLADAAPLFPAAEVGESWRPSGDALVDAARGVQVDADGEISIGSPLATEEGGLRPGSLQVLVGVVSLAWWVPVLMSVPGRWGAKVMALVIAIVTFIVLVHAIGARRVEPGWLAAVALPIIAASAGLALRHERTPHRRPSVHEGS